MVPMFAKTLDTLAEDMQEDQTLGILIRNHKLTSFSEGSQQQIRTLDAVCEFGKKTPNRVGRGKMQCDGGRIS